LEFANASVDLIDKTYDTNGVLLQEKAVKANLIDKEEKTKNKNKNIPDNIIRHQFMSLLFKVARDKYMVRSNYIMLICIDKVTATVLEAMEVSFEKHYNFALNDYGEVNTWRKDRYYNEYADNVLKAWLPVLDAVYKSWSPRKDPSRKE